MVPVSQNTVLTSHVIVFLSHSMVSFFFFPHILWYQPYITQYQHHMLLYFCHIRWFSYFFFLTFYGISLILRSTNMTCDCIFVTFGDSLFFLIFDDIILTLHNTNIIYDYTFVTFYSSLIFFSHLMALSIHYAIPTPHVTVLLSHSIVPLFFSHI